MKPFSRIDMAEVTRLTRTGQLAEAVALLQGRSATMTPPPRPGSRAAGVNEPAQRRLASDQPRTDERPRAKPGATESASVLRMRETMQAFRDRAAGLGPLRGRRATGAPVETPEGARFEERIYAQGSGRLAYKIYVPSGYNGQPLPVVVMLHGCKQNPDDFALGTRMNELAEEQTFLVAYPRQPQSANPSQCWNWFNADNQRRDAGEASLIAGLARDVVAEFSADPTRVYVAGLSAGGAAAAILATTHPDVFAAAGVHSGLACGAASDMASAFAAMAGGAPFVARAAGRRVPTIVFHGDADRTVHLVNAEQVAAQARPQAALTEIETRGATADGMAYTRTLQIDAAGREVGEQWVLHGAGHAWSGGDRAGSFTDPRGPDASQEMLRFFLQHTSEDAGRRG